MSTALLFSALVVASCGLVYELLAGTLASYLLGDSVTQFSTIIGAYLFAMGIGSWLSRHVREQLIESFVRIEILVGLVGGTSAISAGGMWIPGNVCRPYRRHRANRCPAPCRC